MCYFLSFHKEVESVERIRGSCPLGIHGQTLFSEARKAEITTHLVQTYICYSPAGRSVLGKTVPEVLDTARGRRPRAVLKTEGIVFPNMDRPRLVNNIFIFFSNRTKDRTF